MAQTAGVSDYSRMTYRELYIRWQVAVKEKLQSVASIVCTIDNVGISIIHSIPFTKRTRPKYKTPEEYLPWNSSPSADVAFRINTKDEFSILKPLITG